jgi:hypothetical protein
LENGEDWPRLKIEGNMCGDSNQSPIDLKSSGWEVVMIENDNYNAIFQDLNGAIEVSWEQISSYVLLERPGVY